MEKITRQFQQLSSDEKRVYESVLGHELQENQQIILQVITVGGAEEEPKTSDQATGTLPQWCNVYEGLSDEEIAEIETVILDRSHWSRSSP